MSRNCCGIGNPAEERHGSDEGGMEMMPRLLPPPCSICGTGRPRGIHYHSPDVVISNLALYAGESGFDALPTRYFQINVIPPTPHLTKTILSEFSNIARVIL
ncbi:unnamed protein product [Orchesella dallaii]|uniref:Uncharacterized protein n=1 Tax=Orchesella dallaii TaxID=48710 RepID=A0ABP1QVC0_9HEXA